MIPLFGIMLLIQVALCVHAVRTGQNMFWLWIILLTGPVGVLVYGVVVLIPDLMGGTAARRLGQAARETLDPTRVYRRAKADCDETPTVANRMRLAHAAADLGRHAEAESLYREAAQGIHADDPAILLGWANALIELGRFSEALAQLDRLAEDADKGRTPAAALALGRAYEGLGRTAEADTAYQWASERLPGLEGMARYTAFLARTGRREEAREALQEIERRVARTKGPFRAEARAWRDLAAQALA